VPRSPVGAVRPAAPARSVAGQALDVASATGIALAVVGLLTWGAGSYLALACAAAILVWFLRADTRTDRP